MFVFVFFQLSAIFAQNLMVLELGDQSIFSEVRKKIWIENPSILKAKQKSGSIHITGLNIGSSQMKVDNKKFNIYVVPSGYKEAFEKWNKLSLRFAHLYPSFCQKTICLKGTLSSPQEFDKLMRLFNEENASIYLSLNLNDKTQKYAEGWYKKFFINNSIQFNKINFTSPWSLTFKEKQQIQAFQSMAASVGLQLVHDKTKINLNDNIRVEIKVVEIKQELARRLGTKWPDSYSAEVYKSSVGEINPFDIFFNASERSGEIKLLASPNLICKSGKEAEFFAGGEFPIKLQSKQYGSVSWKQYGIKLKIKPLSDSTGQISLEIETEISSIDQSREADGVPALHLHKVSSHFDLLKSKTIILSGLIKNETGQSYNGLPYLSQIPILGSLFSSKDFLENKTELMIFVTPKIIEQEENNDISYSH